MNTKPIAPNRVVVFALAAIVVVGVGIFYTFTRGNDRDDATHDVILVTPRDAATVASLRSRFRWQSMPAATAYRMLVYEVNRTTVWSALIRDTSLIIPAAVELQRGRTYLWRVEAIFPDETTKDSELRAFTLSQ